jgi:cell division protein FtsQ
MIALTAGQYALQKNGFYDVRSIEIQQAEIEAGTERYFKSVSLGIYAQLKKFEGMSLFDVNLTEVHAILSQQLWIEEFQVKRKWPNGLNIKVKTKQVLVNLAERNQRVSPISVRGEKLPAVEMKYAPDRVFFDRVKMYNDTELREKALAVLKEIPRDGKFSHASISVLGFEKDSGFWAKLVDHDVKVQLGFDGISVKSKRVSQVINHLQNAGIDPRVIETDMNKKVLVKTRKTLSN